MEKVASLNRIYPLPPAWLVYPRSHRAFGLAGLCSAEADRCLYAARMLPVHCLYAAYMLPIGCPYTACMLPVHCPYAACTLCMLPVHCPLYTAHALAVRWPYAAHTLPAHAVPRARRQHRSPPPHSCSSSARHVISGMMSRWRRTSPPSRSVSSHQCMF